MRRRKALSSGLLLFGALLLFVCCMAPVPAEQAKRTNITELTLERSYCYGSCPAYKAIFRSDGSLTYIGRGYVTHKGTFVFSGDGYSQLLYKRLTKLAESSRLDQLKPMYTEAVSDVPHTYVTFKRAGKRQTIESCSEREPAALWGYEMAFDNVLTVTWKYAKWKQVAKFKP